MANLGIKYPAKAQIYLYVNWLECSTLYESSISKSNPLFPF